MKKSKRVSHIALVANGLENDTTTNTGDVIRMASTIVSSWKSQPRCGESCPECLYYFLINTSARLLREASNMSREGRRDEHCPFKKSLKEKSL